jgi:DNA-binding IclR family transcriptional regulator
MDGKPNYILGTLEKAFNILDLFTPKSPELSLNEIVEALSIPKTTAFRLLYTLESYGFIRRVSSTGRYRLGLKLIYLGNLASRDYDFVRIACHFMQELRDDVGETVDLTIISNDQVLLIEEIESVNRLRAGYSQIGKKLPLHCTASGKVLAAYAREKISPKWPPKNLPAYTENTITDHKTLEKELVSVLEKGYAIDDEEFDIDIKSYSAPIFDKNDCILAALTIVAPKSWISTEKEQLIIEKLCFYASQIRSELSKYQ